MSDRLAIFRKEAKEFCDRFETFTYFEDASGTPEFYGGLLLSTADQQIVDTYQIRVVGTPGYPNCFPHVFETGGRIPLNIDWHVYADGHSCICSIPEEIMICNAGISLHSFIERQVKPYFFNQKHREMHGFFLKERSHGLLGNLEFFYEIFNTKNLLLIVRYLEYIKAFNEPDRVQDCFCGSGIKYRKCHRDAFRSLKPLSPKVLAYFIELVKACI